MLPNTSPSTKRDPFPVTVPLKTIPLPVDVRVWSAAAGTTPIRGAYSLAGTADSNRRGSGAGFAAASGVWFDFHIILIFRSFPGETGRPGNLPAERAKGFKLTAGDWPWLMPFTFSRFVLPTVFAAHLLMAFAMSTGDSMRKLESIKKFDASYASQGDKAGRRRTSAVSHGSRPTSLIKCNQNIPLAY